MENTYSQNKKTFLMSYYMDLIENDHFWLRNKLCVVASSFALSLSLLYLCRWGEKKSIRRNIFCSFFRLQYELWQNIISSNLFFSCIYFKLKTSCSWWCWILFIPLMCALHIVLQYVSVFGSEDATPNAAIFFWLYLTYKCPQKKPSPMKIQFSLCVGVCMFLTISINIIFLCIFFFVIFFCLFFVPFSIMRKLFNFRMLLQIGSFNNGKYSMCFRYLFFLLCFSVYILCSLIFSHCSCCCCYFGLAWALARARALFACA